MSIGQIRELLPTDDFAKIAGMVHYMRIRFEDEKRIRCAPRSNHFKQEIFGENDQFHEGTIAYVSINKDQIIAMAGVKLSDQTKNGFFVAGVESGFDNELYELIDQCTSFVRKHGGSNIGRFVSLKPGQIRNEQITFWERYGFQADPYFHALIKCEVDEWNIPEQLNTEGISPADRDELPDIAKILREDKEDYLAEEFQKEHPKFTPDHVILTMKSEEETIAIGYYYVQPFKDRNRDGKTYDGLGAWSTGIHFRPQYSLTRKEKRRFIEAVLASMKQLNVIFSSGRVSSRDYDKFIELLSSGFQFHGDTPSTIQNRMCRKV